jgi:hypothetical protein
MARFTKDRRQKIVREFCGRHGGDFHPALFAKEVRATGPSHDAWEWFTKEMEDAANEHWTWQARKFAEGLKISFNVEEVGRSGAIKVVSVDVPLLISPIDGRRHGGGYVLMDENDPEHMAELCRQAAGHLAWWIGRYEAAVRHTGGNMAAFERQLASLQKVVSQEFAEAA